MYDQLGTRRVFQKRCKSLQIMIHFGSSKINEFEGTYIVPLLHQRKIAEQPVYKLVIFH